MHQMLFCWERGDKLQSTEPQPVNHATGSVAWDETLRQVWLTAVCFCLDRQCPRLCETVEPVLHQRYGSPTCKRRWAMPALDTQGRKDPGRPVTGVTRMDLWRL